MAEQLTILGLWERVDPAAAEAPPPPPVPLPPPIPVDPRQEELLAGAHTLRSRLEDACVALDAEEVRSVYEELLRHHGSQSWARHVPVWAEGLEWLKAASADEQARRALRLEADKFTGVLPVLLGSIRAAALKRAALRLVEERGAKAALEDGRPAGYLALEGGDFALARSLLLAACEAEPNAQWLGYLGEAAWRLGDSFGALDAYCRASLLDPLGIDEEHLTCEPVIELLDLSDELELSEVSLSYLAVLADLVGKHALGEVTVTPGSAPPVLLAARLRAYRRDRLSGALDEPGRIAAKRELARLAPAGLRELLRRL